MTSAPAPERRYARGVARHADELHDPVVVEIDDEFSRLSDADRLRATRAWLDSLKTDEPLNLVVAGAEMVAEARSEAEW
jgi:hypothetical protein